MRLILPKDQTRTTDLESVRHSAAELLSDTAMLRTLLDAIETKQHVEYLSHSLRNRSAGLILGADFSEMKVLLSDTYPRLVFATDMMGEQCEFWIRVRAQQRYLMLFLRATASENGLITAEILDSHWSENRRWFNRLHFTSRQGPHISIPQEFTSNLKGSIRNLSAGGALIDIWGKDLGQAFCRGSKIAPTLYFNSAFEMQVDADVLEVKFLRRPCCHTQIRIEFHTLESLEIQQLDSFVTSAAALNRIA